MGLCTGACLLGHYQAEKLPDQHKSPRAPVRILRQQDYPFLYAVQDDELQHDTDFFPSR